LEEKRSWRNGGGKCSWWYMDRKRAGELGKRRSLQSVGEEGTEEGKMRNSSLSGQCISQSQLLYQHSFILYLNRSLTNSRRGCK